MHLGPAIGGPFFLEDNAMRETASDLARRLAQDAEAVCRHYLSSGRRQGRYWLVGDVANTPGRSLFVRLSGPDSGKGAAGKWTDAATGEHGDLLDIIRAACGFSEFRDVLDEARRFLCMPRTETHERHVSVPQGSPESARRLFAIAEPVRGALAEAYLRSRGITDLGGTGALRFHPRCYCRPSEDAPRETWPALLAAVTDLDGTITGVQRTWLARDGSDKAPLATPRRAMGHLLGNGVRFGAIVDVMAAGEGIETMLSLRCALPALPMVAALSANHLAALQLPGALRRLYVARDAGEPGLIAAQTLMQRAQDAGVESLMLTPTVDDFNCDLRTFGLDALRAALRPQLRPEDVERLLLHDG